MSRLEITIDIKPNGIGAKRINARASMTIANLVTIVKDKFNLDSDLVMVRPDNQQPVPAEHTLEQTGVREGGTLLCMRLGRSTGTLDAISAGARKPFGKRFTRAFFREADSLREHDLLWWPAVIGRRDTNDPARNRLLAVDLYDINNASTISRHHVCVIEKDGAHYLESIQDKNPTYINGSKLRPGEQQMLKPGSEIALGTARLTYNLL